MNTKLKAAATAFVVLYATSAPSAVHYQVLRSFAGSDGNYPQSPLIQGSDGALYGTTSSGGVYGDMTGGGVVFRLNLDGTGFAVLHDFGFSNDGENRLGALIERPPAPGLTEASNGILYGTTSFGGANGSGTVFQLNKDGTGYRQLHDFGETSLDGLVPRAGVTEGSDGVLYGTTCSGGLGMGTIFALNKDGKDYRVLHRFNEDPNIATGPMAKIIEASDGRLYGTTYGSSVFRIRKDGSGYEVLQNFGSGQWGTRIFTSLLEARDGMIYGTTQSLVFRLNKVDGSITSVAADGPSSLIEAQDGELYFTQNTQKDGALVFRLDKATGKYSALHDCEYGTVYGGLVLGRDGAVYGNTLFGGDSGLGTVFKLWPAQTPDLEPVVAADGFKVNLAGEPGAHYQLLRSNDLTNWTVLEAITMPNSGSYTSVDTLSPGGRAYYRAVWVP